MDVTHQRFPSHALVSSRVLSFPTQKHVRPSFLLWMQVCVGASVRACFYTSTCKRILVVFLGEEVSWEGGWSCGGDMKVADLVEDLIVLFILGRSNPRDPPVKVYAKMA